jgi:dTDP-L-rhamnose 4-epimerase
VNEARTLITGGMGFIGLKLTHQLLERGHTVTVLDSLSPQIHGTTVNAAAHTHPRLQFLKADITDSSALERVLEHVTTVVHLAAETGTAQSMYNVQHYNMVNSQGTAMLVEHLINQKHHVKKLVLASSRAIYGEGQYRCETHGLLTPPPRSLEALQQGQWEPLCPICQGTLERQATLETAMPTSASIYAATKFAQEDLVRIGCNAAGIAYSILRFQNVYGAGQSLHNPYTGILSIFSNRIRLKRSIPIFEDGLESRDFVHVSDVVAAIMQVLEVGTGDGGLFNVGSGVPTGVLDVANLLFNLFNGDEISRPIVSGQYRLGDIRHGYADLNRVKALGWEPRVNLETGLTEFCDWVRQQPLVDDRLDIALAELKQRNLGAS